MSRNDDSNSLVYLLAGFGLGALVGAAAGLLFAPKDGEHLREDLNSKLKEVKHKTEDWVSEQKAKKAAKSAAEELSS